MCAKVVSDADVGLVVFLGLLALAFAEWFGCRGHDVWGRRVGLLVVSLCVGGVVGCKVGEWDGRGVGCSVVNVCIRSQYFDNNESSKLRLFFLVESERFALMSATIESKSMWLSKSSNALTMQKAVIQ